VDIGSLRCACASEHGVDAECGLGNEGVVALSPHFRLGSRTFFEHEAAEPQPYLDPSKEGEVLYCMNEEIPGRMAIARPSALCSAWPRQWLGA
jgi:hypothetical protein